MIAMGLVLQYLQGWNVLWEIFCFVIWKMHAYIKNKNITKYYYYYYYNWHIDNCNCIRTQMYLPVSDEIVKQQRLKQSTELHYQKEYHGIPHSHLFFVNNDPSDCHTLIISLIHEVCALKIGTFWTPILMYGFSMGKW